MGPVFDPSLNDEVDLIVSELHTVLAGKDVDACYKAVDRVLSEILEQQPERYRRRRRIAVSAPNPVPVPLLSALKNLTPASDEPPTSPFSSDNT